MSALDAPGSHEYVPERGWDMDEPTHTQGSCVRITDPRCRYFGHVGTIEEIDHYDQFPYGVAGLEDWLLWFGDGELVKVAPEAQEGA